MMLRGKFHQLSVDILKQSQVKEAVRVGAEVLVGGQQTGNRGYFYNQQFSGMLTQKCL
jgi:hypothetical protein